MTHARATHTAGIILLLAVFVAFPAPVYASAAAARVVVDSTGTVFAEDVDYGTVSDDQFPSDKVVALRNTGATAVTIVRADVRPGAPFRVTAGLPATIPAGGTVWMIVRFLDPGSEGAQQDTLRYMTQTSMFAAMTVARGQKRFRLSIGAPSAVACYLGPCDPGPLDTVVVLRNTGTNEISVSRIALTNDSNFTLTPPIPMPRRIAAGDNVRVPLRFQPRSAGDKYTTLQITSNAMNAPSLTIPVSGRKESADLTVLSLYFGNLTPDLFPDTGTVFIKNNGTLPIRIDSATFGANPPFTVLGGLPVTLQPSGATNLAVEFADPGVDGYYSDTLAFAHEPHCSPVRILVAGTRISAPKITGPSTIRYPDLFCRFTTRDTSILLTNTGAFTLTISGVTVTGDPAFSIPSRMPKNIPAGRSDTLTLRVRATAAGFRSASILIASNAVNEPLLPVNVFALADTPRVRIDEVHFGRVPLTAFPAVRTVYVHNPGVVAVRLDSLLFLPAGRFTASASFPMTIGPGDSSAVDIVFEAPTADGMITAYMVPQHQPTCTPVPVLVDGERLSLPLISSPEAIEFGLLLCPDASRDTLLRIDNTGGSDLLLSNIALTGDPAFSATLPALPARIAPESALYLPVRFAPQGSGLFTGRVEITSNAVNQPFRTVTLRGRKDSVLLSAPRLDFGTRQPTQLPVVRGTDARNSGNVDARAISARFARGIAYTLDTPPPAQIAAGAQATISVSFAPPGDGTYDDTLIIEYEPSCATLRIPLSGAQVTRPEMSGPAALDFPRLTCDGTVRDTVIVIRNIGGTDLFISDGRIDGDADFLFEPPFTPFAIPRRDSARVGVRFRPLAAGDRAALLTLTNNASGTTTLQVPLTGRKEQVSLAAQSLAFGTVVRASMPARRAVWVRNTGTMAVTLRTHTAAAPFTLETPLPRTIAAGDSTLLDILFDETATDASAKTDITFTTDPDCGVLLLTVSGEQVTPAARIEVGSATAAPGAVVEIPVTLRDARHLSFANISGYRLRLRFNRTLLRPLFSPAGQTAVNDRVIDLDLPAQADAQDHLAVLRFEAALGNDSSTALSIDTIESVGGRVDIAAVPGRFTLDRLCREGGVRLLNPDGEIALYQNTPNPFNPQTTITYEVIEQAPTRLTVLDRAGRTVAVLVDGLVPPGKYSVVFDASAHASGVYIAVLETATQVLTRLMVVMK
ncbi:MAG: choice-of-anchor D domain-containing protein [Ignavibacteriae bacterium]|nr:choice-of-anchor D domain-containing protein [Ignavibacteriota bacterium]